MVREGFKKISFDIDKDLLMKVDKLANGRARSLGYDLNNIIESYFKTFNNIKILKNALLEMNKAMSKQEYSKDIIMRGLKLVK